PRASSLCASRSVLLRDAPTAPPFPYTTLFRSSYEARERGVHSGTPLRTAAARCPEAVFLLADQDAYLDSSAAVMQALGEVGGVLDRKSTRLNSSHVKISYAVCCWKKTNGSRRR